MSKEEFGCSLSSKGMHQYMQVTLLKQVLKGCLNAIAIGVI